MHRVIEDQQRRLDRLFDEAANLAAVEEVDEEIKAQFVWYLCVRVSGYVELAVETLLTSYVSEAGSPYLAKYASKQIRQGKQRIRFSDLSGLLGQFSDDWKKHFKERVPDQAQAALEAVVNQRNKIAHGSDTELTLRQLSQYYTDIKALVEHLDAVIHDPQPPVTAPSDDPGA